ncbi:MAG: flavin reductase family protein [Thermoplasmata archaeon]
MESKALHKISYGMYIVTSKVGDKENGQMANSAFQVTSDPPRLAVSVHEDNFTRECIDECDAFAVSILSKETPLSLIGTFGFRSGRDMDKMEGLETKEGVTGVSIVLDHTVAYIEAEVMKTLDLGSHMLYIGNVVDASIEDEKEVMTYEYYHKVKRGTLSKKASHYIKEEKK